MPPLKNYRGQRFGELEVISDTIRRGGVGFVMCKCDCGVVKEVRTNNLLKAKSCGHLHPMHQTTVAEQKIYEATEAYEKYHPQEKVNHPYFVFHLDGDDTNNEEDNLILTTWTEVYHARLKLPQFYPRNKETREFWRSAIKLARLMSSIRDCEKTQT